MNGIVFYIFCSEAVLKKKVQVGKDQEKAQSERDSHSKKIYVLDKKKKKKKIYIKKEKTYTPVYPNFNIYKNGI